MKKSLLAVLFAVALVVPAVAENMWIGGTVGYDSVSEENASAQVTGKTDWQIAPEFGYVLNDVWSIGVAVSYTSGHGLSVGGVDVVTGGETSTIGIAPFARYKLMSIAGIDLLAKASVYYENSKIKNVGPNDISANTIGIHIVPVVEYQINNEWSVSGVLNFAELGYAHASTDAPGDPKVDAFGFNVNDGAIINIGVSYHF